MDTRTVVVGIEDKQPCAVRFAAESASRRGIELSVVHCLEGTRLGAGGDDLLESAREVVESLVSPPRTRYVLGAGSPYETLLAEAWQASMVVVGTDSVGRMERLFDGTVTEYLVKHAPVPVAIVPEVSWPASPSSGVVLALDAQALATGPIQFAFKEAARRDADLHVVHVAPPGTTTSETRALRAEVARILADWPQQYPDVRLTRRLAHGSVNEVCLREGADAELLVLGRGTGLPGHPVLTKIARHTHGPCVVVPDHWNDANPQGDVST